MSKKHAQNNVELIYINSNTPFIASAYIVERTPVQSLIDKMKTSKVLTKEKVLEKCKLSIMDKLSGVELLSWSFMRIYIVQRTQEDADIIMESETISTKCPVSLYCYVCRFRFYINPPSNSSHSHVLLHLFVPKAVIIFNVSMHLLS